MEQIHRLASDFFMGDLAGPFEIRYRQDGVMTLSLTSRDDVEFLPEVASSFEADVAHLRASKPEAVSSDFDAFIEEFSDIFQHLRDFTQ